jgi:hypothetical protein
MTLTASCIECDDRRPPVDDEGRPTYLDTDEKLVFYCAERALQECDSA